MRKIYTDTLPDNYYDNLFEKVSRTIGRGENACISIMYGQGNKTIYNFLYRLILKNKLFDKILTYDPTLTRDDPALFTDKIINKNKSNNKLIIFRFFEKVEDRKNILEKLKNLQDQNRHKITYLVIADYSAILEPIEFTANTTVFFSDCIYVPPFTFEQIKTVIGTLNEYYNWEINPKEYSQIFKLSGGIGRLVKYICKLSSENKVSLSNMRDFTNNMAISFELNYLTKILIKTSRERVKTLGLTDKNNNIKSLLLKNYFKNYKMDVFNKFYPNLSSNETRILSYIQEYEGNIISIEKISQILKMSDENFSLWAIYKTISRLKTKIKKDYKIKSVRNQGYLVSKQN